MNATLKFEITVGIGLRGAFMRELKSVCFRYDILISYTEQKGFLQTTYFITLEGDYDILLQIKAWIEQLITEFS